MPMIWDLKAERDMLLAIVASNLTEKPGADTKVSRPCLTKKLLRDMNGGPTNQDAKVATPGSPAPKMLASNERKATTSDDELEAHKTKKTKSAAKEGSA
ncbi:hypothetical protein DL764_003867 [Monosporascus ibericus]|uniref:Uncharacterized protein n=1 Tax=Monosporascus ibericus TaxID=155417 RepID=A0A4Q4THM1_9PEZI|nr:hypothetical protein DL764_003867 [Monosporascus ibericus]